MVNSLKDYIGKDVMVTFEKVIVPCKIVDVRMNYGKVEVAIVPIGGRNSQWVNESRIKE